MKTRDEVMRKAIYLFNRRGHVPQRDRQYFTDRLDADLDEVSAELDKLESKRDEEIVERLLKIEFGEETK